MKAIYSLHVAPMETKDGTERPGATFATPSGAGRLSCNTEGDDFRVEITGVPPFRLTYDGAAALHAALKMLLVVGEDAE